MANEFYNGSTKIKSIYKGSSKIQKIYNGSSLVWSAEIFYIFTINATPSNAKVTINGEVTNSATVLEGTEVSYEVSLDGYITQSGKVVVNENTTLNVVLKKKELLYACYSETIGGDTQYLYAKTPLGSDLIMYVSSAGSFVLAETSSSIVSSNPQLLWKSVNENQAVYEFLVTSTCPRYKAGDLYE